MVPATRNIVAFVLVKVFNLKMHVFVDTYCLIDHDATANICSRRLATDLGLHAGSWPYDSGIIVENGDQIATLIYDIAMDRKVIKEQTLFQLDHVIVLPEVNSNEVVKCNIHLRGVKFPSLE